MKKITALLLSLLVLLSLALPVLAAEEGLVEYKRRNFFFGPGSLRYPTDLFPELKDVMPGDVLNQSVRIVHNGSRSVNLRLYIKAEGSNENADFIRQLHLQVEHRNGDILYDGPAYDATDTSGWIRLITLSPGKSTTLDLTLDVPPDLGNEYAHQLGTVVWKFKAEEIPIDPNAPKTGDTSHIYLLTATFLLSAAGLTVMLVKRKRIK